MIERLRRDPGAAFLIAALVATMILYAATLGRGLVNYDDSWLVRDNWVLRDGSWSTLSTIFFDLESPRRYVLSPEYLPIRDLSILLDYTIWGARYEGFHLTNLVIYLASIGIWFSALTTFGIPRKIAGLAIFIWAIHPSHAESVAWVTERKGLLAMMFAGVCALAYARFRAGRAAGWLALAALAAVLAVWSKATGAFTVAALVGLELALPEPRASWRRSLVGLATIGTLAGAAFVPVLAMAADAHVIDASVNAPAGRLAMVVGVHGFYLRASAMTIENAVSYPLSSVGPTLPDLVLGALGLAVLLALAFVPRRGHWTPPAELRAGAAIWLFGWLPASHLVLPLQMVLVADRYLLAPTLGLAIILAAGIGRIERTSIRRALIGALAIAAGLRTLDAQSNWRDSQTLWQRAVASNPADANAWTMYVEAAPSPVEAEAIMDRALQHTTSSRLVHRQALLVLKRDRARGLALMRSAAQAGETIAMSNLALLLLEDHATAEALDWARRGSVRGNAHAQRTLGKVALAAGQPAEALGAFERAYALEPTCQNRFNVGLALVTLGRRSEATPHFDACADDPVIGPRARSMRR